MTRIGVLLVLLVVPSAARAAEPRTPTFEVLAPAVREVAGDEERFVTFEPIAASAARPRFELIDTATGARRTYPLTAGCDGPASLTAAGLALIGCYGVGTPTARLVGLRSRTDFELPRTLDVDGGQQPAFWSTVGRHWVAGPRVGPSTSTGAPGRSGGSLEVGHRSSISTTPGFVR